MANKIDGFGVAAIGAGAIFVYGGIKGYSPLKALTNVIKGTNPNTGQSNTQSLTQDASTTNATGSSGGSTGNVKGNSGSGQIALKKAAAAHGWDTGAEWQALNAVEMAEAGYSLTAKNPNSNAYGMAQFINGPSEYYQYGGDPNTYDGQAIAMINYIVQRYGDPIAAWNHEQAYHWY